MRIALGIIAALLIGAFGYQIGLMQAVVPVAGSAPAVAPYAYGYGWHPFFFPFGFLFPLFFLLLIFGLLRAAFGGWGGRRWGGGPGWVGHHEERERMLEEWHRKAHGDKPSGTSS